MVIPVPLFLCLRAVRPMGQGFMFSTCPFVCACVPGGGILRPACCQPHSLSFFTKRCRGDRISIPIPTPYPYPYPRRSPYPRQPCQKAYSEFEMFGHAESTVDLLHRTDKLCNTCITNLSDEIWAQQWRGELTHRPTDCVWRRSRDAEWVWSSGRCSSSAWPRRRKAHLSSRSASVGPRPWSSSAPSAAPSSVASDLSTYQSKKDNQNSASAWSHI